jgi:hypothetical protein
MKAVKNRILKLYLYNLFIWNFLIAGLLPQIQYTIYKNPILSFINPSNEINCTNTTFITSDIVSVVSHEPIYAEDLVTFYLKSYFPMCV